ncbi:hypothetical protein D3C84_1221230 [compost metagenome]
MPIGQLAEGAGELTLRSVARSMVSLLNQLPARFLPEQCSPSLLREMALGALQGAIAPSRLG